jgi:hypothetical protein
VNDAATAPLSFDEELRIQRWDDHRYYHQSRVNQTLHLISALTFLVTYAMLAFYPAMAAIVGWVVAMCVRQAGHFFFEPKGFDHVNQASHETKEAIKVGFNLERKVVLLSIWALVPLAFWGVPQLTGGQAPSWDQLIDHVGWTWLGLAFLGLFARVTYLMVTRSPQTGIVWLTKIMTDPINDVRQYWRSPLHLLRGEWLDPMEHVTATHERAPTNAAA